MGRYVVCCLSLENTRNIRPGGTGQTYLRIRLQFWIRYFFVIIFCGFAAKNTIYPPFTVAAAIFPKTCHKLGKRPLSV